MCSPFSSLDFHAYPHRHSSSASTPVLGTLWMSFTRTPISLIVRAATSLTRSFGRQLLILMVRPSLSPTKCASLTFSLFFQPLYLLPWTFRDQPPPPLSSSQFIIFTTPTVAILTNSVGSTTEGFGPTMLHKGFDSAPVSFAFFCSVFIHQSNDRSSSYFSYLSYRPLLFNLQNVFRFPRFFPAISVPACCRGSQVLCKYQ